MFSDRRRAGRELAGCVKRFADADAVVLGVARGGIPVAFEVAQAFHAPLDAIVVRKLCVPGHPGVGMGAVGEDDTAAVDPIQVAQARVSQADLAVMREAENGQVRREAGLYRAVKAPLPLSGRTAIVVDDTISTGSTAQVACQIARSRGSGRVVLAAPVAARTALRRLRSVADDVICLCSPMFLGDPGKWYRDYSKVTDHEVAALLARASRRLAPAS